MATIENERQAGPAVAPTAPRHGALSTAIALARLPGDLVVALGYVVRELPYLVQDLRSAVNDVARLAHDGPLPDLLSALAEAAGPDGELTQLLRSAGELKAAEAEAASEDADRAPLSVRRS